MTTVAAGIFIEDGKALIAKRSEGQSQAGCWEFPGGKQEPGETILECLEREIREEFGVACRARSVLCETVHAYEGGAIRLVGVAAELVERNIAVTVHDEYRWVELGELESYRLSPADVALAEAVKRKHL